ncbi:hypothetical protein HPB52_020293 [Rhipicephalus sanguineus]|uniref:Uncharacterized protein n=1 Tax=Rhipicephalus sanguineus TaxID=34632 RepID=A0A9D4TBL3_RHISA|nr:hypothetical protein HPB52_020293 [Rhipicephalus sanguineus]
MDRPAEMAELLEAICGLSGNATPGKHNVMSVILRNSDAKTTAAIQTSREECRSASRVEHSEITLIPKLGKPQQLDSLRPIPLMSRLGKLFEHVVLNRTNKGPEEK